MLADSWKSLAYVLEEPLAMWRQAETTSAFVMVHLGRNEPYKHRSGIECN